MIRHAKISQIKDIQNLAKACAEKMIANRIYQWNEHYPTKNTFIKDIERNELYVKMLDNQIVGTVVVSTYMDEDYVPVQWLTPNKNNIYIHRLSVHPSFQGKGFAQELMNFAEDYSKTNGYASVRLDTFSQNKRNQQFYEQRGYQKLEDIFFPKQSSHPFHCYELVL
ncbi:GNAT family N-acetyltransferase [Flagellimonas sp. HMM57]|uniref:GNAT family N-acetyltransferase n=1 Tax=unclassified Flagellimonas TaxID=2644544 RepID=UPI0013D6835E|nr:MULTISPECIES: GNAT family N-acetyltransferase [unclassified Flagellimonas]UII77749.1 GNAT family N-acetyltransferase [Flagellimonas sp. HMM57]